MINRLREERVGRATDQRYGARYNPGATYYDACDEAIRRGDRAVGTEHLLLALLVDPASPAARAIGRDLPSARNALDLLDSEALRAIGVEHGRTAGPVLVRTVGRLRLTPAAKDVFTSIGEVRKERQSGLGRVLDALVDLRRPDPAAELLAHLEVDPAGVRERFAELS